MISRDERDDLVQIERPAQRAAADESSASASADDHTADGNVGVGVGDEHGDVLADQLAHQTALRMIIRHRGDAAQQHRVVGDDQLRAGIGGLGDSRRHVDREKILVTSLRQIRPPDRRRPSPSAALLGYS